MRKNSQSNILKFYFNKLINNIKFFLSSLSVHNNSDLDSYKDYVDIFRKIYIK